MQHTDQDLCNLLQSLRLRYTAQNFDSLMDSLDGRSPREVLSHIASIELVEQKNRSIARRMAEARIGRYKRMEDFDWKHPQEVNRAKIEGLLTGDFTKLGKNLVGRPSRTLAGDMKTCAAKSMVFWVVMMLSDRALPSPSRLRTLLPHPSLPARL